MSQPTNSSSDPVESTLDPGRRPSGTSMWVTAGVVVIAVGLVITIGLLQSVRGTLHTIESRVESISFDDLEDYIDFKDYASFQAYVMDPGSDTRPTLIRLHNSGMMAGEVAGVRTAGTPGCVGAVDRVTIQPGMSAVAWFPAGTKFATTLDGTEDFTTSAPLPASPPPEPTEEPFDEGDSALETAAPETGEPFSTAAAADPAQVWGLDYLSAEWGTWESLVLGTDDNIPGAEQVAGMRKAYAADIAALDEACPLQ